MGIDWMTGKELSQAIPPAYTEWIGKQIMEAIRDIKEEEKKRVVGISVSDECEAPCQYPGCEECAEYWQFMVDQKLWIPGEGWSNQVFKG